MTKRDTPETLPKKDAVDVVPSSGPPTSPKHESVDIVPDDGHRPLSGDNKKIVTINIPRLCCPQCQSTQVRKNGHSKDGGVQYYRCAVCSDPTNHRPYTFRVKYTK